jgi:DNA-directed RNA polymerase subunit delta
MHQGGPEKHRLADVDLAYFILKQNGNPKYYKDLIMDVLTTKGSISTSGVHGTLISGVYTQITLDSRFVHLGKGVWGLGEWYPKRGVLVETTSESKENDHFRRHKMLFAEIQDVYAINGQPDEFEKKFDEVD